VYTKATFTAPAKGLGAWGPTINFPLVPVAAAILADTGRVLTWSSWGYRDQYNNPGAGKTLTSFYDPATGTVGERLITNTQHDMFCPGLAISATGQAVVTGGNSAKKTSIYVPGDNGWVSGPDMKIARGYQSSVTMGDGRIFVGHTFFLFESPYWVYRESRRQIFLMIILRSNSVKASNRLSRLPPLELSNLFLNSSPQV
jgi:galactose oxidase